MRKHPNLTLLDGYSHSWPHSLVRRYCLPQRGLPSLILLDQQEQLGWHQIFLGQFSTLWCDLQTSHLRRSPSTDGTHSSTSWILSIIIPIWIEVQSHWEARTKVKHGDTGVTHLNSKFAQVLRETEALYKPKPSTLPCGQGALYPTFAICQASLTKYTGLLAWVNTWRPTFISSVKDAKE
jgi:hypothetical protein